MASVHTRDPRLAARKRPASQSPDGNAILKKLHKPGETLPPPMASRQASFVSMNGVSPSGSRRSSVPQPDGITSGRSTPLSAVDAAQTPTLASAPVANMEVSGVASALSNDVYGALMGFSNNSVDIAMGRIKYHEARARLTTAKAQVKGTQHHFGQFPAIKEEKLAAVAKYEQRVNELQREHDSQACDQQQLARKLTSLIIGAKPANVGTDHASREEYLGLQESMRAANSKPEVASNLASRVDSIESRLRSTLLPDQTVADVVPLEIKSRLDNIEASVKELEEFQERGFQEFAAYVESEVSKSAESTDGKIKKVTDNEHYIFEAFDKLNNGINENAKIVNECRDRVDQLLNEVGNAAPKSELDLAQKSLEDLSSTVRNLQTQDTYSSAAATTTANNAASKPAGPVQFTAVMPAEDGEDVDTLTKIQKVQMDIEMLKHVTQEHTNQYNNLTTDAMAQQMVDQMSVMFPAAKDAQTAFNSITARIGEANNRTSSVMNVVNSVTTRVLNLENDPTRAEVGKLRTDLTAVSLRVDNHDEAMSSGQKMFEEVKSEVKTLKENFQLLQGEVDSILDQAVKKAKD